MHRYLLTSDVKQVAADTAAAGTWVATGFAWLANVNEVLQFIALATAIVSAVYAAKYHKRKTEELDDENQ